MRIQLIAAGNRMPKWVNQAYAEYSRRLPQACRLELVEIPLSRQRSGQDLAKARTAEDERMHKAIPARAVPVALTVEGKPWSTEKLARELASWMQDGQDRALLVGGPEGLGPRCLEAAQCQRSLSALTLPHPLVRVILAEQLFRAHSILVGHPYHRG